MALTIAPAKIWAPSSIMDDFDTLKSPQQINDDTTVGGEELPAGVS